MNPRISHAFLIITLLVRVNAKEIQIPELGALHPSDKSYELVWQEEFSDTQLDRKKWSAIDDTIIGQYGHGNGEAQAYLDSEGDTFFVKNGKLSIVAHYAPDAKYPLREKPHGKLKHNIDYQDFKSAKLTTEKLHSFTYGILEARIKNPTSASGERTAVPVWPAFWLMPEAKTAPFSGYWDKAALDANREWARSTWPYSGEIDIMEMSGRATRLYHAGAVYHTSPKRWTVGHIGWYSHYRRYDGTIDPKQWIADQKLDPSLRPGPGQRSYVSGFHVYGCKWTKERIIFMLDGKEWGPGLNLNDSAKFGGKKMYQDYPFYLILNLAVGGNYFGVWGPNDPGPDKKGKNELYDFAQFPQSMQIDWVRVYQKK
ncbi:MAG: glycoside hydrolase family 16 protein [Verrucomicrobiota bacterium]|nr:glycoside hydrolase family 16 protein [Verrucomicrobiota bacterium]